MYKSGREGYLVGDGMRGGWAWIGDCGERCWILGLGFGSWGFLGGGIGCVYESCGEEYLVANIRDFV